LDTTALGGSVNVRSPCGRFDRDLSSDLQVVVAMN